MFRKIFLTALIAVFTLTVVPSYSKGGFKGSSFKSYKPYNYKYKQDKRDFKKKQIQKKQEKKSSQKKPSFFNNPIFKYLIGGMIFGALISFLLGYGFHIGAPGLLEILLIAGVFYFLYRKLKKNPVPHH